VIAAATDNLAGARASLRERIRQERAKRMRRVYPCDEFRDRPVAFSKEVLHFEPWDKQAEWMDAMAPEGAAVSVASGHKTGKSSGAASVCLWFWATRRRARVPIMAPKIEHVEVVLWPEIRRFYLAAGRCAECLQWLRDDDVRKKPDPCEFCSPLGDPRWIGLDPTKGLRAPDGREIFAYTARKPDAIGGLSGPEMLFVFDEASGIDDAVFEAMKGNEAGGVRKLLIGNPLRTTGEFFDSHHGSKRFYTYTDRISSEDTPNARTGKKLIPGLATREWCEERAEEWGKDSPLYAIRVRGEFPKYEAGQLVPVDVLIQAEQRWESTKAEGRLQIGVDVAFTGDDAAIALRRGQKILELTALPGMMNEDTLAAHVVSAARAHRRPHEPKPLVVFDANGPGARLRRALEAYEDEIEIVGVNGTARPRRPREYFQLRDEIACVFAEWLLKGGAIPTDKNLEGEISHTRAFDAGGGRKRVISNDRMREILKRSPDRRNACELAVWDARPLDAWEEGAATEPETPAALSLARGEPRIAAPARDAVIAVEASRGRGGLDPYAWRGGRGGLDPYAWRGRGCR